MTDARLWLEEVELGMRSCPSADRAQLERDIVAGLEGSIAPIIGEIFDRFEEVIRNIERELQPVR